MNHTIKRLIDIIKDPVLRFLKGKLLWRFLITYMLVILLMTYFLWHIQNRSLQTVRTHELDNVSSRQEFNLSLLEDELFNLLNIHPAMEHHVQFIQLRTLPIDGLQDISHYSDLLKVRNAFRTQISNFDLVCEAFLYFPKSGSGMSTTSIYLCMQDLFASNNQNTVFYQSKSPESVMDMLNGKLPIISILPAESMIINNMQASCLTVLVKPENYSVVFGFLIPENEMDALLQQEQSENGYVRLIDESGAVLYESGTVSAIEKEKFNIVSNVSKKLMLTLENGVPESYVQDIIQPLHASFMLNMLISLVASLLISLVSSVYNAYPVQKLAKLIKAKDDSKNSFKNEFAIIQNGYLSAIAETESLNADIHQREEALRLGLMTRLLLGGLPSAHEEEMVMRFVPDLYKPYRLLIAEFTPDAESHVQNEYLSVRVNARLKELLPEAFSCVQLEPTMTVFLLNADILDEAALAEQLKSYIQTPDAVTLSLVFGLSDVYTAPSELSRAFVSAQIHLQQSNDGMSLSGDPDMNVLLEPSDLTRLSVLIRSSDVSKIEAFFDNVQTELSTLPLDSEALPLIYYSLAFIVWRATIGYLPNGEAPYFPSYLSAKPAKRQLEQIKEIAIEQAQKMQKMQDKRVNDFAEQLRSYIHEHFSDPLLDVDRIADAMHISRSVLYRQLKDTEMTSVAKYIHTVRMEKAMNMLKQTDLSVTEIATACGYSLSATFTRAFQKTYGIPPSSVRKSIHD
ncbi:MAG: helix-turn-helix transcriptional regulator [Clostridia bacterium]|nr:helix-turn-helix transcriptional regulator [Clostridia bacterium]